jgi:hypothetical protein
MECQAGIVPLKYSLYMRIVIIEAHFKLIILSYYEKFKIISFKIFLIKFFKLLLRNDNNWRSNLTLMSLLICRVQSELGNNLIDQYEFPFVI